MRLFLRWGSFFLAGGLTVALASPGRAAEDHQKGEAPKYTVEVEEDGHMTEKTFDLSRPADADELAERLKKGEVEHLSLNKPPDLLTISWDLGLWTLIVFLLLYFILKKMAWGPILQGLRKREETIRGARDEALHAQEEAQKIRAQLQAQMDRAQETVRQIHEEARRRAQQNTEEMIAKARTEIQGERERLRREIETARDQALQELWNQTAQLATVVSAKAIRRQLTPDDHRRLVDEALAELRHAGNDRQREGASVRA